MPSLALRWHGLVLSDPAVRVTDEYLDFPSAGDQRHVYPCQEWERRKSRGLDMYD